MGKLPQAIITHYGLQCTSQSVWIHSGVIKHINKRHPGVYQQYGKYISDVISNPDFVGQNPTEPNSVELIKVIEESVLIAIKLDPSGYLYLSTFYPLNNGSHKIKKRLKSGRLQIYQDLLADTEKK
ncbi:MAG: PBECR2 nuclease fold domain-containing protein [Turicibacter sp.]|nr:PBECR2 nuclease fold domain-containing protein [Turicibacter sp.]